MIYELVQVLVLVLNGISPYTCIFLLPIQFYLTLYQNDHDEQNAEFVLSMSLIRNCALFKYPYIPYQATMDILLSSYNTGSLKTPPGFTLFSSKHIYYISGYLLRCIF